MITGGGSFGHKLFGDAAIEAAKISKTMGKPVRLMWHRADEPRQGRLHPMVTSRIRATHLAGQVLSFEQRHTSVVTDFSHGLGEMITSQAAQLPAGSGRPRPVAVDLHADPGAALQLRRRHPAAQRDRQAVQHRQHAQHLLTGHRGAPSELVIDQLAARMGKDPLAFRLEFLKTSGSGRCCARSPRRAAGAGRCRPAPPRASRSTPSTRARRPCLVEIDCRPETVNRKVRDGVTGPRVTKAVIAVDAGLVINPRGLEAQMMGGFSDGIALTLTSSCTCGTGTSSRPAGTTTSTPASGTCRRSSRCTSWPPTPSTPAAPARPASPPRSRPSPAPTPGRPARCRPLPDQPRHRVVRAQVLRAPGAGVAHRRPGAHLLRSEDP